MTKLLQVFETVAPGTKFLDTKGNDYYFQYVDEDGAVFIHTNDNCMILIANPYINYKSKLEYSKYEVLRYGDYIG